MSHVFHQLYFHFAWATHSREPLIDRDWRPQLLEINEEVKTRAAGRSATTRCLIMRIYTLIDRKNIICAELYLICWRHLNAKMIGLKHCGESLLKEAKCKTIGILLPRRKRLG